MKLLSIKSLAAVVAILGLAACSTDSANNELLQQVPDNAQIVVVGNIRNIVESTGGTLNNNKLKLPSYLTDLFSESENKLIDEVNETLKSSDVNPDYGAMFMNIKDKQPTFVIKINDKKKFCNYIEDEGYREKDTEDGVSYYQKCTYESSWNENYNTYTVIAVKSDYAYILADVYQDDGKSPVKMLKRNVENAKEAPYSKTPIAKYIAEANTASIAVKLPAELRQEMVRNGMPASMLDIMKGYVCLKGDLNGNKAQIECKFFDEDGKARSLDAYKNLMDYNAKVSKKALDYLNKDEILVMAQSLKDVNWDEYIDIIANSGAFSNSERGSLIIAKEYLKKLDGTMAIGLGVTNGLESIIDISKGEKIFSNLSATIVLQTKDDKAKGLINDIKSLLDMAGMPYDAKADGFSMPIPQTDGTIYAKADDDNIVFSCSPISDDNKNQTVKKVPFTNYLGAIGLYADTKNALMKDFDIRNDICMSSTSDAKNMAATFTWEFGGDGTFLQTLIKNGINASEQAKALRDKLNPYSNHGYYNDYDYEEAPVEAVFAEDSCYVEEIPCDIVEE